jgi:polysaccharide pyruvyl transferase WcaK-like protein
MSPKVLVYGWYGKSHNNLGDEFFIEIFRALFPSFQFTFVDHIFPALLKGQDAVFLGGGSFLDQASSISPSAIPLLKKMPLFYLGVGVETNIHPWHEELLYAAKLIVLRSSAKAEEIRRINSNVIVATDLVYLHSLLAPQKTEKVETKAKSILILPNVSLVPQWHAEHWKHLFWEHFRHELAQFLDELIDQGHHPKFFSMCQSKSLSDDWAALAIISTMKHRSSDLLLKVAPKTIQETLDVLAGYETVITQRYHGIVLAELAGIPYMAIAHHDKLANGSSEAISYYEVSKAALQRKFESPTKSSAVLPLKSHPYAEVKKKVEELLVNGGSNAICGHQTE